MATQTKRSTVYLEPDLHKALRLKALETSTSVSELINQAVKQTLAEDAEDLAAFEARGREPLFSYVEMVKRLKIGSTFIAVNHYRQGSISPTGLVRK